MNVSIERLTEIEKEREQTQSRQDYQKWVKELNVSRVYRDKSPIYNAQEMMRDYKYSVKVFIER